MRRNRIKRSDYARVLVTETLPFETPVIFSNDGLYSLLVTIDSVPPVQQHLIEELVLGKNEPRNIRPAVPFFYKIRKNSIELRKLALIHPRSQWKMREFYERYENLILYHCNQSPASIRAPNKVAGSFFFKNSAENINRYKTGRVALLTLDELTRHSPSFFAYRGHDRLYRFFESRDYFDLEKRYSHMRTLDVSKCFDSIYTHTMSWAVKDKEFTKKTFRGMGGTATFANEFDTLMQSANHGETNGIVIGPEISRVFAEIIFQKIDLLVISRLKDRAPNLVFGDHFEFRRYVDDVFIFAETPEILDRVYRAYADGLSSFNLHANAQKSISLRRPFVTNKSRLIQDANRVVTSFLEKFLSASDDQGKLKPLKIHNPWKLTRSVIEAIKGACSHNQVDYDQVAGYLIAVITERIKKLVSIEYLEEGDNNYLDALLVLLDVLYFLYQVSPSVSSSYKLCTSVILAIRFTRKHLPAHEQTVAQRIFQLTDTLLRDTQSDLIHEADGFLPLEKLNVILATRELGQHYLLSESRLTNMFPAGSGASYFSIIACLFYVKDETRYENFRQAALQAAEGKLAEMSDIRTSAEKTYLLLDLLTCPYVPDKTKKTWLRKAFSAINLPPPSTAEISTFLSGCLPLHVNWQEIDLLHTLEKKELKRVY